MNTRSLRWYRRLLRAYPRAFRARFADGMYAAFARDLERRRGVRVVTLWIITVWHVVTMGPLEYLAEWRGRLRVPASRGRFTDGWLIDLRSAWRGVRMNPVLSTTVVATLGVGIGGATALFGLVNALVLRPLPVSNDAELFRIRDTVDRPGQATWWYDSSERSFVFMKEHGSAFGGVSGGSYRQFDVTEGDEPVTIVGSAVAEGWFEALGVTPAIGRGFTQEEQRLGENARVVLIGYGMWATRFGGDSLVLGRSLTVDGQVRTIVGVLPVGFTFPYGAQLWIPGSFHAEQTNASVYVVVRSAQGMSPNAVEQELLRLSRAATEAYPDSHRGIRFTGIPIRRDLVGNRTKVGFGLLAGVVVLVLIACANVANLLTIRAVSRRREMAVRAALGASRWRQLRHFLTETVVLTSMGWAVGLGLAFLFGDALSTLSVPSTESFAMLFRDIEIDARVLCFSLVLTGATAVGAALLPLTKATSPDIRIAVADESNVTSRRSKPILQAVVVSEMALTLILLLGAGALVDDLGTLERTDLGFDPRDRLVVPVNISPVRYPEPEDRLQFVRTVEDRLRSLPGVRAVGFTQHTPVSLGDWTGGMTIEGGHESTLEDRLLTNVRIVTPGYLDALGAQFVEGRTFSSEEMDETRNVVIVTETMARIHWPSQHTIGHRVKVGPVAGNNPWLTVVGVVQDVKEEWNGVEPTWYFPYRLNVLGQLNLVVHFEGDPAAAQTAVRRAMREIDVEQPVGTVRTMSSLVDESFSSERFGAGLAVLFAAFAVLLAVLGVYGVLSFTVRQRAREIGLRLALGSSVRGVMYRVVGTGFVMLVLGVSLAAAFLPVVSYWTRIEWADGDVNQFRLLSEGLSITWPRMGFAMGVLLVATIAASVFPARRAVRLSPAKILREG